MLMNSILVIFRMTLLLGPPGAGKTTLLLALAGKLDQDLRVCIQFGLFFFFFSPSILVYIESVLID